MRSSVHGHAAAGSIRRSPGRAWCAAMVLLIWAGVPVDHDALGQRHLPNLQVFRSSVWLALDTQVEDPAVNNGRRAAPLPRVGQVLEVQCFIPQAAGRAAFECSIEFGDSANVFTNSFQVASAKDCFGRDLTPVQGSKGAVYAHLKIALETIPATGHVLTVALSPTRSLSGIPPLDVRVTVTIASVPERRVWQMEGRRQLFWM